MPMLIRNMVCSVDSLKNFFADPLWKDFCLNSISFAADLCICIDGKVLACEIVLKDIPYNDTAIIPFYNTEDRCFITDMIQCRMNPSKISIHIWLVLVLWGSVHRTILWSSIPSSQQRHLDFRPTQKGDSAVECSDAESHFWTSPAKGKYIPSKNHLLEFSPIVIVNHARHFTARERDRMLPRTCLGFILPCFQR